MERVRASDRRRRPRGDRHGGSAVRVAALPRHPWFKPTWLAASERSEGKTYAAPPWRLATPIPDAAALPRRRAARLAWPEARVLRPRRLGRRRDRKRLCRGRPHRRQQRAQLPDGSAGAAADPGDQPRSPQLLHEQQAANGWTGAIVTNPNCSTIVPGDGAGAAPRASASELSSSRRCRRCRVRDTRACPRSTSSATSCRSSAAKKKRWRWSRRRSSARDGGRDAAPGDRSAPTPPACRSSTATPMTLGRLCGSRPRAADVARRCDEFRAGPRNSGCRSRRQPADRLTGAKNRPQPRLDAERGGGMAVSSGRLRPCPVLSTSSWRSATTRCAARPARPS